MTRRLALLALLLPLLLSPVCDGSGGESQEACNTYCRNQPAEENEYCMAVCQR